ncbi:restriction endonuclease subunit S [Vibrio alginolyticus]|uniref:restriction endonuclease subunit S n=1 Tax=Vibrio kanaloae TaxID=170673 RepID=UPI001F2BDE7B|nr:restriction endonuclease subunit S [Vibrio kanaloae]UIJ41466.1 restriction endonuclease subunit S [Vibrio kanaloae]HCG5513205.1 restriction endonuclease subunit S [Vibrio parahaemolyticus]
MVTDTKYPPSVKAGKPILGETPEGWARESLKKHLTLEQRKVKVLDDKEYDLVTVKRSRGGVVRREHLYGKQISVKSQFSLKQGDFLISKRQIVHGACGIVPEHLDGSIVSNEYSIFTAKDSFDLNYLRYLSETLYFQQTCFHSSIGVHIEKMIFKLDNWFKWDFNLPPLSEQRKIAQILSTWDKAIAATAKLIETSKQQKKALMQQLLTGKKRLVNPETGKAFEGEWEEVRLSEIAKVSIGLVTTMTKHYVESGVPLIRNSDIKQNEIRKEKMIYLSESFASESEHRKLKINDVVTVHTGEVGVSSVIGSDMAGSLGFATLNSRPDLNKVLPTYLSWYFNSDRFINWCVSVSTGDGRQNLNLKDFAKAIVLLPELAEQQKIASVLTAADKEIKVLEAKLANFKQEKKALMQQLLTGTRRVKIDDKEVA